MRNIETQHPRIAVMLSVVLLALVAGMGCDQVRSYLQPPDDESRYVDGSGERGASGSAGAESARSAPQAAARRELPLPDVMLDVEPNSWVLAPRPSTQVNSIAVGFLNQTLYDVQRVLRIEGEQVYLDAPLEEEHAVHAALVLPLSQEPDASIGDRIIVPAAGKLAVGTIRSTSRRHQSAIVRSQRMQIRYELKAGGYYLVDPDDVAGHFAFCDSGTRRETYLIIRESEGLYVAIAPHGGVRVFSESDCNLLPLDPSVRVGDTVVAELLGSLREATVEQVSEANESVELSYVWRDSVRNQRLSFGLFAPVEGDSEDSSGE